MRYKVLIPILFGGIILNSPLHAQILTKTVSRFDSLSNLTYKMTLKEKPPLSDRIFNDTLKASFALSNNKESFNVIGTNIQEVYDGNKLIKIDLNNLTYSMTDGIKGTIFQHRSLPYIISSLKQNIKDNAPIKLQKDSILNGKEYFDLGITERDTVEKGKRVYRIIQVLIDKKSYLPIYYRSEQQGFVDGTEMFVDAYYEIHFYDYQLNQKEFAELSEIVVPSKFSIEKPKKLKPLLVKGIKAPKLYLTDIKGNSFQLESQKGKIVLLNFTTNSCPHGIESINMLNHLFSKYRKKNFTIITINPYDDKEAIEMYNKKGNIKYPIFINADTHNTDSYNVDSYPAFYLIDKNGDIIKGFDVYYKSTKEDLNNLIKEYL